MIILVTGGAGFIGSHFARRMIEKCDKVVVLDKLTYAGNMDNLEDISGNPKYADKYSFHKGDICDMELVNRLMEEEGIDVIANFAAETHVDRSIMSSAGFIDTDVKGTFVLLEAAREYNIQLFVQISTDEVYGSIAEGSFSETDTLYPRNPYAASKAGADRLAYSYWVTHDVPLIITRSSNNYGPNQYPEKFLPLFITNALEDRELPLYGDGKQIRDWLHVQDNCSAIDFLIQNGKHGEVYNIAGENEHENIETAGLILDELNKPTSLIKHVKDRKAHDRRYSLNCSKLHSLGWQTDMPFEEGIRSTVRWYVENESWWRKVKDPAYWEYYKEQYEQR